MGGLFGSKVQMYIDYYNFMSFRHCNINGDVIGHRLNLNNRGIVVNSNTSTSDYNLEVYGSLSAYIRGPLKVLNDITDSNSVSLISTLASDNTSISGINTSIDNLRGKIFTLSGSFNTNTLGITSLSGLLYTDTLGIISLSGLLYNNNISDYMLHKR